MMIRRITALKIQNKNPNRVNVYLDGKFSFGLSRVIAERLKLNENLSNEKIIQLQNQDTDEVALQNALHFLSHRPRSEAELHDKLTRKGFDEAVISKIISRLCQHKLLGDEQFANFWIENRMTFRPRSKRMLTMELRQKRVSDEIIQKTLCSVDDEVAAYQLAVRYARRIVDLEWNLFRKKLGNYLARHGFTYEIIVPLVRQIWSELNETTGERIN